MMEVATRTSYSWFMKASMTRSSSASGSWPWPMTTRAAGDQLADFCGEFVDGFDAVVDEVGLAAAFELHLDGGADEFFVELGDDGLDGHAVFGRRLDDRHIT